MDSLDIDINLVADYICMKFINENKNISVTKLHKLLYLCQAWYMANYSKAIFNDDFEAWIHGPVSPSIHKRFTGKVMMTLPLDKKLVNPDATRQLNSEVSKHVDMVIQDYGDLTFLQLEEYFHENDLAWKDARNTDSKHKKTDNIISKKAIMEFYKSQNSKV
ncbi:MAG: SocA family protein [Oligoflexia bacterium]|nr:SocA family protein [Oligoflexia bacterium]